MSLPLIPAQVLTLTRRVKALVDKGLDQPAEEIVDEVDCRVSCAIAALARSESGLSGKEADEQRDNLEQAVRLLQTTPSLPANRNRARARRRLYDTIAALGRSESGLSGKEADEQRDNLMQAVRLLRSEAR